jgi:LysR family transcriptional activator of dmlA
VNNPWDLVDLRIFCTVARASRFNAAAAELGISPAAVSKRIADLESALGVVLFQRTTRRVQLTEEGALAYESARRVLDAAEGMAQELSGKKRGPIGTLRISTSMRLGRNHVSHVLSLLRRQHMGLEIWLEVLDRKVDLIGESFDIDIRMVDEAEPHLHRHLIARSRRVLVASPDYVRRRGKPQRLADLTQHDCLLYRERHLKFGAWRMDGPRGPESVKVTAPIAANNSEVVRNWAVDGHGIALLSGWDVAPDIAAGNLVRVLPGYSERADIWAVTAMRLEDSAKVRICVEFLKKHLTSGPFALDTSIA